MNHPAPKIANYIVIRLLAPPSRLDLTPAQLANTLLLDTITVFPHASVHEFLEGISLARALTGWRANDGYERQLVILADAVRTLVKP